MAERYPLPVCTVFPMEGFQVAQVMKELCSTTSIVMQQPQRKQKTKGHQNSILSTLKTYLLLEL